MPYPHPQSISKYSGSIHSAFNMDDRAAKHSDAVDVQQNPQSLTAAVNLEQQMDELDMNPNSQTTAFNMGDRAATYFDAVDEQRGSPQSPACGSNKSDFLPSSFQSGWLRL